MRRVIHGVRQCPGIPEPVFHACAAPLDERDQDSAVNDLRPGSTEPVIRLISICPYKRRTASRGQDSVRSCRVIPLSPGTPHIRQASSIAYTVPSTLKRATARPRTVTAIPQPGGG